MFWTHNKIDLDKKKTVTPIDTKNYHNKINKIYELTQLRHTEV